MDRCDAFAEAVLDEKAARPAGFEEHLAGCPRCQGLVKAHRAALRLEGAVVPARVRVAPRRVVARLAVVGAVLVAIVVGVSLFKKSDPITSPGEREALVRPVSRSTKDARFAALSGEGVLTAEPPVDFAALRMSDDGWAALADLHAYTQNTARRNPSLELAYADRSLAASYLLTSTSEE